jgi:hypothetical protein
VFPTKRKNPPEGGSYLRQRQLDENQAPVVVPQLADHKSNDAEHLFPQSYS